LKEVGRVFQPLLVTHGGPILMVQVENEYGFYGKDASYMGNLRKAMIDAGIDVPLFACNPTHNLKNGFRDDLFNVVNFGSDPAGAFKALREVQPKGPLMNGEFYPGWFDTWGNAHRTGTVASLTRDLDYMLSHDESFSLYMAHGGTTFGLWSGADSPFKPDATSYDYDAPISESGKATPKFFATRELMKKYLLPGESIPNPPAENPVVAYPQFTLAARAPIFDNLPAAINSEKPQTFETLDLAHGMMLYRTTLPAGSAAALQPDEVHDFGFVYLDGKPAGIFDRRSRNFRLLLPAREKPTQLDILVEAVGRVNFSVGVHDRKGLHEPVRLIPQSGEPTTLTNWQQFPLPLDYAPGEKYLASLKFTGASSASDHMPAFYQGTLKVDKPADTYLDLRNFSKGVAWVNGHCLGRFWNIGPTQTMYTPGPWLHAGDNQVLILDLLGPTSPASAGLDTPILNELHTDKDFGKRLRDGAKLALNDLQPTHTGSFAAGSGLQEVKFEKPVTAQQLCVEAVSSQDGKNGASMSELEILDESGKPLSHATWNVAFVSSEDLRQDGSADNAIDGQTANAWHTAGNARFPQRLVIDLGKPTTVTGIRYLPAQGDDQTPGRIKEFKVYTSPTSMTTK
jgi:beta-galactosidase